MFGPKATGNFVGPTKRLGQISIFFERQMKALKKISKETDVPVSALIHRMK
jgi:hypothetical protein